MRLWYGLKVDGELEDIKRFDFRPTVMDFGKIEKLGNKYEVVMVRVRELATKAKEKS